MIIVRMQHYHYDNNNYYYNIPVFIARLFHLAGHVIKTSAQLRNMHQTVKYLHQNNSQVLSEMTVPLQ